ncbi:MAG: hypothetical protein J5784_00205 [Muribaculaceae bacterium]|nr:hypothetical protein [Muribaculaceae bacterium]
MIRNFLAAVIVLILVACSDHEVRKSLSEADSLACVFNNPACCNTKKAAYILSQLRGERLNEREKALFSLVDVQCKYKNVDRILRSDVDEIDGAISYFTDHDKDGDYLLRSLIFKGAILEELDEQSKIIAVDCYNEAVRLPVDNSYWKGYAKFRLANMYDNNSFVEREQIISLYRQASEDFKAYRDSMKLTISDFKLGSFYCQTSNDSCRFFAEKSYNLAKQINDAEYMSLNSMTLATYYMNKGEYEQAVENATDALRLGGENYNSLQPYYYLACSYLKLGKLAMAKEAAAKFEGDTTNLSQKLQLHQLLAEAEGRYSDALRILNERYLRRGRQIEGKLQQTMLRADLKYEKQKLEIEALDKKNKQLWGVVVLTFVAMFVAVIVLALLLRGQRLKKKIVTMETVNADLHSLMSSQEQTNVALTEQYSEMVDKIREFGKLGPDVRDINAVMSASNGLYDKVFFNKISDVVNMKYGNVISRLKEKSTLKSREITLISLLLYGFNAATVASVLGYKNAGSIYVIRKRIENKLGIKSIEDLVGSL